jgi:hypothetical protein
VIRLRRLVCRLTLISLALALGSCAKTDSSGRAAATQTLDLSEFIAAVDTNHDGCISNEEWFAKGLPKSAHDMLVDANACVTLNSMRRVAPPPGIDLNGDGKLSLEEFIAFDRKGPPTGPPPTVPAPAKHL